MTRIKIALFAILLIVLRGMLTIMGYEFAETVYDILAFPFGLYVLMYMSPVKDILDGLSIVFLNYIAIKIDIGLWVHTKPEFPNLDEMNASIESLKESIMTFAYNLLVVMFLWIN